MRRVTLTSRRNSCSTDALVFRGFIWCGSNEQSQGTGCFTTPSTQETGQLPWEVWGQKAPREGSRTELPALTTPLCQRRHSPELCVPPASRRPPKPRPRVCLGRRAETLAGTVLCPGSARLRGGLDTVGRALRSAPGTRGSARRCRLGTNPSAPRSSTFALVFAFPKETASPRTPRALAAQKGQGM